MHGPPSILTGTIRSPRTAIGSVVLLLLAIGALNLGCVRRRLTVRSDPPGALVYVDDQEVGITPVSVPFTHYGTRKIQLVQDGSETVTQLHAIKRPWYQYPVIEFFAENVYPREIRDEREVLFQMTPQRLTNIPRLVERAAEFRDNQRQGVVAPLPPGSDVQSQLPAGAGPVPAQAGNPTEPLGDELERLPGIR